MSYQENRLSASAIKYLFTISDLCKDGNGVRCIDVSTELKVTKPSAHHMIQSLCDAGLAERERYGAAYLTENGFEAAKLYKSCYDMLFKQIKNAVSLDDNDCRNAACAALEQIAGRMMQAPAQKGVQND